MDEKELLDIDIDKIGNLSSAEISNIIDAYEKRLCEQDKIVDKIEDRKEAKAIELLKLRLEIKAIEAELSAEQSIFKDLRSRKKRVERKFWSAKDMGL